MPPGASMANFVSGSTIGTMPVSSSTVATQIEFDPDIGGVSAGSMTIQPVRARGSFGGTSRFTCRKTPPRGSFSTKLRSVSSCAMKRDCCQIDSPGGGATPPTMTSPTSPSAWQLTTWMIVDERMAGLRDARQRGPMTTTGSPSTSKRGATPRPGRSGAVMLPSTRFGAPSAIVTVP